MPSLLESTTGLLDEHRAAAILAPLVGGDDEQVDRAIRPSLGRIIEGLATMADRGVGRPDLSGRSRSGSSAGGEDQSGGDLGGDGGGDLLTVADLIERHDRPGPENVADYLNHASPRAGDEILDRVFGAERGLVVVGLASGLDLTPSLIGRLLPMLAPLVTADLAARWDGAELPALARMLSRERRALEREGLLDGLVFDLDRLVEVVSAEEQPASARSASSAGRQAVLEPTTVESERSPSITIEDTAEETMEESGRRASTLTVDPEPPAGRQRADRGAGGADEGEVVELGRSNDDGCDEVTGPAADLAASDEQEAQADSRALSESAPAGEAPTTESSEDDDPVAPVDEVARDEAALDDEVEEAMSDDEPVLDDQVKEAALVDEPVLDDEVKEAALVDGAAPDDELDESPAPVHPTLAWLGWAIGAVVLVLLLAWLLSSLGDDDGSTSTTAVAVERSDSDSDSDPASADPTLDPDPSPEGPGSEPDPAGPTGGDDSGLPSDGLDVDPIELDADALLKSGIEAILRGIDAGLPTEISVVASGGAVTLAGEVESETVRSEVEAAVASLAGVTSIDNQITVAPAIRVEAPADGSVEVPAADLVTGATLNELLDLAPVTFEAASSDLTRDGRLAVDEVAWFLLTQPSLELEIAGHTDDDGEPDANAELSQARADVVFNRLVAAGVEPGRLSAVGYGADRPKVPNDSLDNKAVNRRIEFVVR